MIEEIFGVHEHIKDMCRRFAKQGFHAVAPEFYARIGNPAALTDIKAVVALVNEAPDRQAWSDLDRTIAWAAGRGAMRHDAASPGGAAAAGWSGCTPAIIPALKAGVAWYGPLGGTPSAAMPTTPLDVAGTIRVPQFSASMAARTRAFRRATSPRWSAG